MKRLLIGMAALVASALPVHAVTSYNQAVASQVIGTTTSFVIDNSLYGNQTFSATASISSATPVTSTFSDGQLSTGSVTVLSTASLVGNRSGDTLSVVTNSALSPSKGSQSIFISSNGATALAFSTITIAGVNVFASQWTVGASSSSTASSIASAINATVPNVVASANTPPSGATVTITCVNAGSFCNSYTIKTSTIALLTSTGTTAGKFTGGNDNATFTITNRLGVPAIFTQGIQWNQLDVSSNTAVSILNAINATPGGFVASTPTTTSVLINSVSNGTIHNAAMLTTSTGALTAASTLFTGGQDNQFISINGIVLTQGKDWFVLGNTTGTANSIASAINSNSSLSSIVIATNSISGSIVYTTATATGVNAYGLFSSTAALSISSNTLRGGQNSAINITSDEITIPNHGLGTGMQVLYTSATATVGIPPLLNGATYFIIAVDANNVRISTSASAALANIYQNLTSSTTTGPHNFTLTPLALTGTPTITWQEGNDGNNWSTVNASTTTSFVSPYAPTSTFWDFGTVTARYLRATVSVGVGGVNTTITGYGTQPPY